jgi:hypothetical protein
MGDVASLSFTLAQLRALAPGEVLAATGYAGQHVVSEGDFQAAARKFCDQ